MLTPAIDLFMIFVQVLCQFLGDTSIHSDSSCSRECFLELQTPQDPIPGKRPRVTAIIPMEVVRWAATSLPAESGRCAKVCCWQERVQQKRVKYEGEKNSSIILLARKRRRTRIDGLISVAVSVLMGKL